ncbi:hypothetical protein GCM10029978_092470 [Actinoallomurus acanthiterrae]
MPPSGKVRRSTWVYETNVGPLNRAFGMAVSLYEAGAFSWPEFQAALVARIAAWEATAAPEEP